MPGLLDIGNKVGEAAPGEYGPSALATTRGDTIVVDSTGKPVRLALGASGTVPRSNGTDLVYASPPGRRLLHDAGTTATNPTAATTVLAGGASSNLWPTYVTAGDIVRVTATGSFNMHTSATVTWTVLMGATTVATLGPNASTVSSARRWALDLWFEFVSSTSVKPTGVGWLRTPTATGFQSPTAIGDLWFGDGTAVTVSAAPQNFDLKALISASDAASVVVCDSCDVWHYPA